MFFEKKINPDTFSPKPNYGKIQKELNSLCKGENFKFVLSGNNFMIKKYDEMIVYRHKYAHANTYHVNIEFYEDVIRVIEYLIFEYNYFILNFEGRSTMANDFSEISRFANKCQQIQNEDHLRNSKDVSALIECSKKFVTEFEEKWMNVEMLSPAMDELKKIGNIRLKEVTYADVSKGSKSFLQSCLG